MPLIVVYTDEARNVVAVTRRNEEGPVEDAQLAWRLYSAGKALYSNTPLGIMQGNFFRDLATHQVHHSTTMTQEEKAEALQILSEFKPGDAVVFLPKPADEPTKTYTSHTVNNPPPLLAVYVDP